MDENKTKKGEAAQESPKETLVKIRLPKTREDKAPVPVWVNDRSWLIERGATVEVPECVAEVLRHREEMLEVGIAFDEANER